MLANARFFGAAFETLRPLSFASGCLVAVCRNRPTGLDVVVKTYFRSRLDAAQQLQVGAGSSSCVAFKAQLRSPQVKSEIYNASLFKDPSIVNLLLAIEDHR